MGEQVCSRLKAMSTATATKVLTDRINRIEVSATMAITAEALRLKATGISLSDFGAGEPHFETPRHIKDAAIEAINSGFTRYTAVAGTPGRAQGDLRAASRGFWDGLRRRMSACLRPEASWRSSTRWRC